MQSSQFQSELEKTNKKLLGFSKQSTTALSSIERQARSFGRALTASIGVGSLTAITGFVRQAINLGDELGKAAVKAGIGAKAMSELAFAAKMADIEIAGLSNGIRFMQVAISKASSGGKEQLNVLRALGIELGELQRQSPDKQFEALGDAISRLKDPADRARAATELFGRSGADLLPLFSEGAEGIRKAREEAEKFGHSFSEETIKALQDGDEAIKKLGITWDVFWSKVAVGVVKYGEAISGAASSLSDFATQQGHLASFLRRTAAGIPLFGPLAMAAEAQAQADAANDFTRGGGPRRGRGTKNPPPGFAPPGEAVIPDAFTPEMRAAIAQAERFRALIDETDRGAAENFQDTLDGIENSFSDLKQPIMEVNDEMTVFAEQGARNMQDAFAQFLFDPFDDGLKGMLKGFIDVIRQMAAQAAAAKIFGSKDSGGFGLGDAIGDFFGLAFGGGKAKGGPLQQGKWYVAGEHGPEPIWGGGPGAFAMGYGSGGVTVNMPIDMRGATQDAARMLIAEQPRLIRQAADLAKAELKYERRQGKF